MSYRSVAARERKKGTQTFLCFCRDIEVMEKWTDGEEEMEVALQRRQPRYQKNTTTVTNNRSEEEREDKGRLEESVYFYKDRGTEGSESSHAEEEAQLGETGESDGEEEVMELEFKREVEKLDTHTMYIPNWSGFNLFRIFGFKKTDKSIQIPQQEPAATENLRPSDIAVEEGKVVIEQDEKSIEGAAALPTKPESEIKEIEDVEAKKAEGSGCNPFRIFGYGRTDKNTQNSQQEPVATENPPPSEIAYEKGNMVIEQGNVNNNDIDTPDSYHVSNEVLPDQSALALSLHVTLSLGQTMCINGVVSGPTTVMLHGPEQVETPTFQGPVSPGHQINNVEEKADEKTMKGAALPTKPESKIEDVQNFEDKNTEDEKTAKGAAFHPKPESTEIREINNVEAKKPEGTDATMLEAGQVKPGEFQSTTHIFFMFMAVTVSIVYGGLVESIANLGVVSSAAAADATKLNILVLGLANLIGGLFIIGHNFMELKNDGPKGSSNERNVEADRYQKVQGQRENFLLLATVAVLSFLVFGLLPHVTYGGFSFWKSDNRGLKFVPVAAASLLCIAVLAFGKAHIRRPPKCYRHFKSLLYYVNNAVLVSGVFYMVGDLIKKLVEKI
ncbi:membrane protein of ER body-like protein [Cornus florida]|uniref:membrane protein of ER body-like protein n=1 Tax=Cornus florida TaxID=4283 RepID=UPI00289B3DE9|nr:membrane protein of ER body-like protein [Cornus florida]